MVSGGGAEADGSAGPEAAADAWDVSAIHATALAALQQQAAADEAEQAVYGFDAWPELTYHPLLADAYAAAGWGAHRECRFPSDWQKRRKTHGERCDLVLTRGGRPLQEAGRNAEDPAPLFIAADPSLQPVPASSAFWLEVKLVAQFEVGGAFRRYAAELGQVVVKDLKKLRNDPLIRHAGLLLILQTANEARADRDLSLWLSKAESDGWPVDTVVPGGFPINDRIGNAWCSVTLVGVCGQ